jgi:hypothetical protein
MKKIRYRGGKNGATGSFYVSRGNFCSHYYYLSFIKKNPVNFGRTNYSIERYSKKVEVVYV